MPIPGTTPVLGGVAPNDAADPYPAHFAQWGKGGLRTVDNTTDRDNITTLRREEGMLVYVKGDGYYQLGADLLTWSAFTSGGGSPSFQITNNLTSLRAIASPSTSVMVFMLGYTTPGDGFGRLFYWDSAGAEADDPPLVVRPNDFVSAGVWKQAL